MPKFFYQFVSDVMCSGSYVVQDKLACACLRNDGGTQSWR
jgi:hypothetical protein